MIGNPEQMEDPTGHVMNKITAGVTTVMVVQEALHRRKAQRVEAEAAAARLRAEAAKTTPPVEMMPAPDRGAVLKQWEAANARGSSDGMREAERVLTHVEPDLMRRYTELTRTGKKSGEAMGQAVQDSPPNPNPPSQIPAVSGWDGVGAAMPASGGWGAVQRLVQVTARSRKKGAAA